MKFGCFWCYGCCILLVQCHKLTAQNNTDEYWTTTNNETENGIYPPVNCSLCYKGGDGVLDIMVDGSDSSRESIVVNRPIFGSNKTCHQPMEAVQHSSADQCAESIATLNAELGLNVGSYCGCGNTHDNLLSAASSSGNGASSCSFCRGGMPIVDAYLEVPKLQNDLRGEESDAMTCADYEALSPFITDAVLCEDLQKSFAAFLCCPGECTFCPLAEQLEASKQQREFIGANGTTCGDLTELVAYLPASSCNDWMASFDGTFDPTVYCGCPGMDVVGTCIICDEDLGLLKKEEPHNIKINNATCGAYYDLADATLSDEFCLDILSVDDIREICCYGAPTMSPTSRPTTSPSLHPTFIMQYPSSAQRHLGCFVSIFTITLLGVYR